MGSFNALDAGEATKASATNVSAIKVHMALTPAKTLSQRERGSDCHGPGHICTRVILTSPLPCSYLSNHVFSKNRYARL